MRSVKAASALLGLLFVAGGVLAIDVARASQPPSSQSSGRSDSKQKPDPRWWHDEDMKRRLGLTTEQVAQVEKIFQSSLPNIQALREEFARLEKQIAVTIGDPKTTETLLSTELDLVEAARSRAAKARTIMLFRMRRVLTPEQRVKLEEIHKHSDRDNSQRRRDR